MGELDRSNYILIRDATHIFFTNIKIDRHPLVTPKSVPQ
jgi:hypothetical protein